MPKNPQLQTDATLVRKAQKGDRLSFETLMHRYHGRVYRVIIGYMRDASESHDVTQEVFLKVYQNINQFEGRSGFYTWVYRIALNTVKNYLSNKKVAYSIDPYMEQSLIKDLNDPESLLLETQTQTAIDQAVAELPKNLRESLVFRLYDGLKYDEIAERMDCPIGTVRSRLYRAREEIEKVLGMRSQL